MKEDSWPNHWRTGNTMLIYRYRWQNKHRTILNVFLFVGFICHYTKHVQIFSKIIISIHIYFVYSFHIFSNKRLVLINFKYDLTHSLFFHLQFFTFFIFLFALFFLFLFLMFHFWLDTLLSILTCAGSALMSE